VSSRWFGVAIGLPEPWTSELQRWREELGDRNACGIPPHVTLLPPTCLDTGELGAVEEHLRDVAAAERPFVLHLRGSASFRPVSPVVFVCLVEGVADCKRVEERVRSGPLQRELRFPYHPHVTVAHDLDEQGLDRASCALEAYEARFSVWGFTLFEKDGGGVWRPQRDFTFGAGRVPGPAAPPL